MNLVGFEKAIIWLRRATFYAVVVAVLGYVVMPLVITLWVAFFSDQVISFPPAGYTVSWFPRAWTTGGFRDAFLLSAKLGLLAMLCGLAIGVPAAVAIARGDFRGKELINTLLLSPLMIPAVVSGCAMYLYYIEIELASDVPLAGTFPGLLVAHVVITIPWVVRLVTASLVGMDRAVEEASMNLGANRLVTFWRVTLPVIKPGIVAAALFSFIASFADLERSMFLVGPGKQTLSVAIITYLEWQLDPVIMAVATIQITIIGASLVISDHYVKLSRAF